MTSLVTFTTPVHPCSYFPDRAAKTSYEIVADLTPGEFQLKLETGWRRFGHTLFRPTCPACRACQSLRVPAAEFRPDRSQKRAWARNRDVDRTVGVPSITDEKLTLYDTYHAFQSNDKGWPELEPESPEAYANSFVQNPFVVEEWQYRLDGELIGVGYVDRTPDGLSAIYFYYNPEHRHRSLGTFNVLSILATARADRLPYVYLGYYVEGFRSLEYKIRFRPNQTIDPVTGAWRRFRD
ncbi:MAG TPA: arginyltransferase [Fimbriiglobus sp.]|jgi:arginine-tRNA-protein transferase